MNTTTYGGGTARNVLDPIQARYRTAPRPDAEICGLLRGSTGLQTTNPAQIPPNLAHNVAHWCLEDPRFRRRRYVSASGNATTVSPPAGIDTRQRIAVCGLLGWIWRSSALAFPRTSITSVRPVQGITGSRHAPLSTSPRNAPSICIERLLDPGKEPIGCLLDLSCGFPL